jgi:lipopolysaccharide export LptBFGC system permease protein LptF
MWTFNLALCALAVGTCAACMGLLFRRYAQSGARLLFWSGWCFLFLTVNNILLFLDLVVLEMDLRPWRHAAALPAVALMIVGLLADAERR